MIESFWFFFQNRPTCTGAKLLCGVLVAGWHHVVVCAIVRLQWDFFLILRLQFIWDRGSTYYMHWDAGVERGEMRPNPLPFLYLYY
jgi:hypothetical protein